MMNAFTKLKCASVANNDALNGAFQLWKHFDDVISIELMDSNEENNNNDLSMIDAMKMTNFFIIDGNEKKK